MKKEREETDQRWVRRVNLDPIVLIAYGSKCLIFY